MTRGRIIWIGACLICFAALPPASCSAEQRTKKGTGGSGDAGRPHALLRLPELLKEAEAQSPEIQAALYKYKAAKARPSQEGSLPDPTVGFMATNMGKAAPFSTVGDDPQSNAGVSFSQEIPFPGKLSLKGGIADKEAKSEYEEYQAAKLAVLSRVKSAYYQYAYLWRVREILRRNTKALESLTQAAQARYEAGSGSQQDVFKAHVERSVVDARLVSIEQKRAAAAVELNALLNRTHEGVLGEPGPLEKPVLPVSLEDLVRSAQEHSPVINSRRALVERDRLAVDLARRSYYPDFMIGGYYGDSGDYPDMWQWRLDLKVPLFYRSKQRYAVKESIYNLKRSQRERDGLLQSLTAPLKSEYLQARASADLVRLYS